MGEIPENHPHAKSNNIFHEQATPPESGDFFLTGASRQSVAYLG